MRRGPAPAGGRRMSMDRATLARVIDEFWAERERGVFFPPAWENRLDLDDAYRIQLGLVARRWAAGAAPVGWEGRATAQPLREPVKVHGARLRCPAAGG